MPDAPTPVPTTAPREQKMTDLGKTKNDQQQEPVLSLDATVNVDALCEAIMERALATPVGAIYYGGGLHETPIYSVHREAVEIVCACAKDLLARAPVLAVDPSRSSPDSALTPPAAPLPTAPEVVTPAFKTLLNAFATATLDSDCGMSEWAAARTAVEAYVAEREAAGGFKTIARLVSENAELRSTLSQVEGERNAAIASLTDWMAEHKRVVTDGRIATLTARLAALSQVEGALSDAKDVAIDLQRLVGEHEARVATLTGEKDEAVRVANHHCRVIQELQARVEGLLSEQDGAEATTLRTLASALRKVLAPADLDLIVKRVDPEEPLRRFLEVLRDGSHDGGARHGG